MQNPSGWLQGIQYFRAIAILEVIAFHVLYIGIGTVTSSAPWILIVTLGALIKFTSFGVQHFVFISGVVLYNKYNNGFSLSTFYKKRFSAVVPPYLFWSTFYFAFVYVVPTVYTHVSHRPTGLGSNQSVVSLAHTYLGQVTVGFGPLWFVLILIQLYLLYPLLEKIYNRATRQNSPFYLLSFLLLAQIGYVFLITAFFPQFAPLKGVFSYVFYFVLGFFIAQHYEAMKQRVATLSLKGISLVILASTIFFAVISYQARFSSSASFYNTWLNVVTGPFYCLLLILFYLRISTAWGEPSGFFLKYLEKIGEDSFGIFLAHWFFIITFPVVLSVLGLSAYTLALYPVLFLLTIILSYMVVEAIYRLPFSTVIVGNRRKKVS